MLNRIIAIFIVLGIFFPGVSQAGELFSFAGAFDFQKKDLAVKINTSDESILSIEINREKENKYKVSVNADHLKTDFFDISTELSGLLEFIPDDNDVIESMSGKFSSKYTLINYKPSQDLAASLEFKDNVLKINSFSADHLFCKGSIQFAPPYDIDVLFQITGMDMNDFLAFFADRSKITSKAEVDGDILVSGNLRRIELAGSLVSYDGFVNELEYRSFILNAKGIYPVIEVGGSNIIQEDGTVFNLVGSLDLSDEETFRKQIGELIKEPVVNGDEKSMEWTLKRVQFDEKGTTELKYLRRKNGDINGLNEEDSGMLGLERKIEF